MDVYNLAIVIEHIDQHENSISSSSEGSDSDYVDEL